MTFRKKIILSQIISFLIFFAALFPLVEKMSALIIRDSLIESTTELKKLLEKATTEEELFKLLKRQEYYNFFRIGIVNDKGLVIFDTHLGRLLGDEFRPYYPTEHEEVKTALKKGVGYVIAMSDTFKRKFVYVAERFDFQGKTYVLRTAFPYEQIYELTQNFAYTTLIYSFIVLIFFNVLIWFIFNRFTAPIREIITAITPYQKKEVEELPEIQITAGPNDEFNRLASTFNSLSKRIQEQINSLKAEKSEKEAILESLGEGVIAVDEKMHVRYINFIACKLLGLVRRSVLDKPLESVGEKVNQSLLGKCKEMLAKSQSQGSVMTDTFSFGEKKTTIDLVAAPKAQGTGAIIVLQDKTEHYRRLEIGKDFVANASHELRTPITIIKGYAETLHDMPKLSREQFLEITEKIGRSCERMETLVQNLLRLADIENIQTSRFQQCDLTALLENCRHTLVSVYPSASITLDVPEETLDIDADSGLLELAFTNILDNAVKYSPDPAQITIHVTKEEDEGVIQISDKGKGIPQEDLDRIFERFYRVDKTHSRKLGGAGLGLSIVKTIITKHDGTIKVISQLHKGTTFIITLPLRHHNRM